MNQYTISDLQKRIAYYELNATNPYNNLDDDDIQHWQKKAADAKSELAKIIQSRRPSNSL